MDGIALPVIADLVTDLIETLLEKAEVILVAQLGNRFVGIEEIVVTVLLWRNIGHQHICSCQNRLFSSPGFDRLQCGGGGDIDIGHQYPQQGYHPECHPEPFLQWKKLPVVSVERGLGMADIGSHPAHVDIELLHEEQVIGQIFSGLGR